MWDRHYFSVEANSKEEAIEYLKEHIDDIVYDMECDPDSTVETCGSEMLYDTSEYMTIKENGGFATIEWYDNENTKEMLFTNGKS